MLDYSVVSRLQVRSGGRGTVAKTDFNCSLIVPAVGVTYNLPDAAVHMFWTMVNGSSRVSD